MENALMKDNEPFLHSIQGNGIGRTPREFLQPIQAECRTPLRRRRPCDNAAETDLSIPDRTPQIISQLPSQEILEILRATAHDIRGPLVNLAAGLKLIQKGSFGPLDPVLQESMEKLFMVSTNLIGTLEDSLGRAECLLDGASGFHDDVDLKKDVIDPVLNEVSRELRERCAMFHNTFDSALPEELLVRGDRFWLKFVFRNLVRNALKYGGKGVKIAICFKALEKWSQINIYNSGIPVPEQDRGRLFTKFARLGRNLQGRSNGLGLGLHLVKEVIQKHGGDIWYEPKRHGSNFVFTLPRS